MKPARLILLAILILLPTLVFFPNVVPAQVIRFAVIADFGEGDADEEAVADLVKSLNPDFIVTAGDNTYTEDIDNDIGQFYSDYIGDYTGSFGSGSSTNRFFPCLGNHDWGDDNNIDEYLDYFKLPGNNIPTSNTSGNERYYDFIQGVVHFFLIDGDHAEPDGRKENSKQAEWLKNQLGESTTQWKVVMMHFPPYSSGKHGSLEDLRWPYEDWGADVVIAGHNHSYERILRDDNGDGLEMPYIVNGLGGRNIKGFPHKKISGTKIRWSEDFGAMLITADNSAMTFEFYSIEDDGKLIDSYTMNKGSVETNLSAGDVIISGFQTANNPNGQNPGEFISIFNTTADFIALDNLELILRNDGDGEIYWKLSGESPNLSGKTITPYSFFLIAEDSVDAPANLHDVEVDLALPTGEAGAADHAISIELSIDDVHMDYLLYGRHDGTDTGAEPAGDIFFDGDYPREEVIRNTRNNSSFSEGVVRRLTSEALHAGHDIKGFYTDEEDLGDGKPIGHWSSPHKKSFGDYEARNSLSPSVPPESGSSSGAVIIAGFQAVNQPDGQNPGEFITLFNPTEQEFFLENLEIITRVDSDGDGEGEIDWRLSNESPDLHGKKIEPYSFFLIAEEGVAAEDGVHDLEVKLDLTISETGFEELAVSIELIIDQEHVDYVLYGRHDGSNTGFDPEGDLSFDGDYPRDEVIRNTRDNVAFSEGLVRRESAEALHAGPAINGFYTDEDDLGDGNPDGFWTSRHVKRFGDYEARNSRSSSVPPPQIQPVLSVTSSEGRLPTNFSLFQNYPNPFNPETEIRYQLKKPATVTLLIYDVKGREVQQLVDRQALVAGEYRVVWDGLDNTGSIVASGIYFYQMRFESELRSELNVVQTKKMIFVR